VAGRRRDDAADFLLGRFGWILQGLDDGDRRRAIDGLRAALAAHTGSDGVRPHSAAWLVHAVRPSTAS